jgi:hypothetical protein
LHRLAPVWFWKLSLRCYGRLFITQILVQCAQRGHNQGANGLWARDAQTRAVSISSSSSLSLSPPPSLIWPFVDSSRWITTQTATADSLERPREFRLPASFPSIWRRPGEPLQRLPRSGFYAASLSASLLASLSPLSLPPPSFTALRFASLLHRCERVNRS